jgi:hypothetical protein
MPGVAGALVFPSVCAEQVATVIRPALDRGAWVVCDRYVDSSIVYQGIARGLGAEQVLELNRVVTGGLMPARTFVLALSAEDARSRQAYYLDRIEREDGPSARSSRRATASSGGSILGVWSSSKERKSPTRSRSRCVSRFEGSSEEHEAKRLLDAAVVEGPVHAYLFHGPAGVGKRKLARAFALELLCTTRAAHPDLYELDAPRRDDPIDAIRELRRDLHMRPFEADRRVYLILAHLMNEDAADAP